MNRIHPRLRDVTQLARKIAKVWNALELDDLAEQIIYLEDKISQIEEPTPGKEKVKHLAEHLHFKFVFPLAAEFDIGPLTFASAIKKIAKEVLDNSMDSFKTLNSRQLQEINRYLEVGA
jgi:hypothetical protein